MRGAKAVVLALRPFGEAGEPAALAKRTNLVPTGGQDLVWISLVPDIPYEPVTRRIEEIVERNGQFAHPEACPEVPASDRNGADCFSPQLVRYLPELLFAQPAEVRRVVDRVENWSWYRHDCNNIVASTRGAE